MSRRVRGRSFKITKNQAKGYGYAKARSMKPNPGVTTIAAINGRGAYAARGRSARSVMGGLKKNARRAVARRRLSAAEKAAFKKRMAMAKNGAPGEGSRRPGKRAKAVFAKKRAARLAAAPPRKHRARKGKRSAVAIRRSAAKAFKRNRSTSPSQSASSRSNIKKAQRARKAWGRKIPRGKRVRVGRASYGRKPKARRLKPGVYIANRRKKAGSKTMARRRKRAVGLKKKRRSSKRRRTSVKTSSPKRRRRKSRKGAARRKRTVARKTVRRRRRKSAKKLTANRRRRSRKAATPKRRRRSRKAVAAPKRRRRRKSRKSSARRTKRTRRVSRRRRSGRKLKANGRRRKHRRNPRKKLSSNRRRRSHRKNRGHKKNRRHRRNGRRSFKMNGVGDVLKVGAVLFGGFALHRVLSNVFNTQVLQRLLPAPAAPAATSGFDLSGQSGLISSLLMGAVTGFAASKVIKNADTKKLVVGGIVMSTIQGVVLSLLKAFAPSAADALSGPEDGTAARLSAMYGMRGLGAGASIMPRYGVINGMGEYFREPMNGLGEYFREPMNGLGEYISATNGLGTYEQNSDLHQAAAGFGSHDYNGNHIDPSGDLDRQLTIAEAAAGVGAVSPFEAAAGIGPMQAAAGMRGFGAIDTVPSGDTWIPGSVDPQLWAGVKAITNGQSATAETSAGILQGEGGSGIFG
jgi:uncharacterized membrane protein YeaQ/YmgE (transglycosylase-associated protein family)